MDFIQLFPGGKVRLIEKNEVADSQLHAADPCGFIDFMKPHGIQQADSAGICKVLCQTGLRQQSTNRGGVRQSGRLHKNLIRSQGSGFLERFFKLSGLAGAENGAVVDFGQ